jgi:hypothetical protein
MEQVTQGSRCEEGEDGVAGGNGGGCAAKGVGGDGSAHGGGARMQGHG